MKMLLLAFGLSASPTLAFADSPPSAEPREEARLVPVMRNSVFVGLKVVAIAPNSQFARAGFVNGDIIESVDHHPITTDVGARKLDKVISGTATATVDVRRRNEIVRLTSRVLIAPK